MTLSFKPMHLGGCSMTLKLAVVAMFIMSNLEVICYIKCIADIVKTTKLYCKSANELFLP